MRKSELETVLRRVQKENRGLRRALDGAQKATVECAVIFARELMQPPLTTRGFAVAIGERTHRDVLRFLTGCASKKSNARIRSKVDAWLAPRLAHTKFSPDVIASLDDGALRDVLFWSRYVAQPKSRS